MISRFVFLICIAVLFYLVLPALHRYVMHYFYQKRFFIVLKAVSNPNKIDEGICTDITDSHICYDRYNEADKKEKLQSLIPIKGTQFVQIPQKGSIEFIRWNTIESIQKGTTMLVFSIENSQSIPTLCMFHAFPSKKEAIQRLLTSPSIDMNSDAFSHWYIALGAALEFLLFIYYFQSPDSFIPAIAALIAIFSVAIPWCPPGLFFTLLSKKNRWSKATSLLISSAGVLLNSILIFWAIFIFS